MVYTFISPFSYVMNDPFKECCDIENGNYFAFDSDVYKEFIKQVSKFFNTHKWAFIKRINATINEVIDASLRIKENKVYLSLVTNNEIDNYLSDLINTLKDEYVNGIGAKFELTDLMEIEFDNPDDLNWTKTGTISLALWDENLKIDIERSSL